ncbi:hypothetical protein KJ636_03995 [Patescibacteria group bacterium]|nr:hypothetical protein [Patescibacteria group bacterium]MBU4481550.1 hypothetical protein [Patescibacteria group bacterium]
MFNLHSKITNKTLRYYFINKKYPLLKEAKKTFELKYGIGDLIATELKKIKGIKESYIFGSYAEDIFVMGNEMRKKRNFDLYDGGILISEKESLNYKEWLKKIISQSEKYLSTSQKLF